MAWGPTLGRLWSMVGGSGGCEAGMVSRVSALKAWGMTASEHLYVTAAVTYCRCLRLSSHGAGGQKSEWVSLGKNQSVYRAACAPSWRFLDENPPPPPPPCLQPFPASRSHVHSFVCGSLSSEQPAQHFPHVSVPSACFSHF